jgi:hypothetical protein
MTNENSSDFPFAFFRKKPKNLKFEISSKSKKNYFEKSSSTKFLFALGESMFRKSAKSEMAVSRLVLVDSSKKNLMR